MHLSIFILIIFNLSFAICNYVAKKEISYCVFTQKKFSDPFDFSKLTNDTTDYRIEHEQGDFVTLQLCKPLKSSCGGLNGYAVCYSKQGKEYAIGKEPPEVLVNFGETVFRYTGEKCINDHTNNYTVNIKMICDNSDQKTDDILMFPTGYNDCDFNIEWRTRYACAEMRQVQCTLDHESGHYDLTPLINYKNNYEVPINDTYLVVLNVCHTVLYRPNSCKSDNAACLVIKGKSESSKNLGALEENLVYDDKDKTLSLTYKDGAICLVKDTPNNQLQTTIKFICDQNAINTLPKYIGGMEECHYKFEWITAAACSEQVLEKKSLEEPNHSTCSVKNPVTNFVYNFSSLMNKKYSVHPFGIKELYEFNICAPLLNTSCTNRSGVCKIHGHNSGGIGNSNLLWKDTGPYLNYTNGNECTIEKKKMYTIIEFYCNDHIEETIIEDRLNLCYNIIKMSTELACSETEKSCITADKAIDLNPLMLGTSNYVIKHEDSEFYINVCRPLVREEHMNCPTDAAICKLTNKNGKLIKPVSLGSFSKNPTSTYDHNTSLLYSDGSSCDESKGKKFRSNISFLCDISKEIGKPVFLYYKNCTFFFEWKTASACGKVYGTLDKKKCMISNTLGDTQSLSVFNKILTPQFTVNNSKTYNVSLCGFTGCNGGFICTDKVMFGTNVNLVFDYSANSIQMNFTQGTLCSDGNRAKSSITLKCDETAFSTKPQIIKEDLCNVEFIWYTSEICQRQNNNTTKLQPQPNESIAMSSGEMTSIIFAIFLIVIAIVYSTRRWHLIELITNSTSRHCDNVRYSRNVVYGEFPRNETCLPKLKLVPTSPNPNKSVNTEEEVHLLLDASDPNVIETDSDDDLLQA